MQDGMAYLVLAARKCHPVFLLICNPQCLQMWWWVNAAIKLTNQNVQALAIVITRKNAKSGKLFKNVFGKD